MAFLGSSSNKQSAKTNGAFRTLPAEHAISIIGPGMQVVGDLVSDGTVRIEGCVHGTVRAGKCVVVGKGGEILGDIVTQDAVIAGRVTGTVIAQSRLELQSSCMIEGEIRARSQHLAMEQGARFNGQIHMIDEEAPLRVLPAEASQPSDAA